MKLKKKIKWKVIVIRKNDILGTIIRWDTVGFVYASTKNEALKSAKQGYSNLAVNNAFENRKLVVHNDNLMAYDIDKLYGL